EGPEARTLVLRAVDRAAARLTFHTDMASPKVAQIRADPRVALHVWIPKDRLQIRIRARATVQPGDPAIFAGLPAEARRNYGGAVPGGVPDERQGGGDVVRFACILLEATRIDALLLDDPHRRAIFEAPDWHGRRVAP
ncbi:MAG: pyridoxamine 5'-phosphate oxidase family protein, partial [Roseicyclus sp.]